VGVGRVLNIVGLLDVEFASIRVQIFRKILHTCLQFDGIGNATAEMREISKRAKDALLRIGKESPINARRVRTYGIKVEGV
jgi:hypothetical protein